MEGAQPNTVSAENSDQSISELLEKDTLEVPRRSVVHNSHSVVEYFQQLDMTPILPNHVFSKSRTCTSTPIIQSGPKHLSQSKSSLLQKLEQSQSKVKLCNTTKQLSKKKPVKRERPLRIRFREMLSKASAASQKSVFKRSSKVVCSPPLCILVQPCFQANTRKHYYYPDLDNTGKQDILTQQ